MARRDGLARFTEAAAGLGVEVVAVRYPEGTRTAVDAARAIGCGVDQIVKSLVVVGPDGPAVALTAGHHRLDLERLGVLIGGPARMAGAEEARAATGYSIGGTPAFSADICTFCPCWRTRSSTARRARRTPVSRSNPSAWSARPGPPPPTSSCGRRTGRRGEMSLRGHPRRVVRAARVEPSDSGATTGSSLRLER